MDRYFKKKSAEKTGDLLNPGTSNLNFRYSNVSQTSSLVISFKIVADSRVTY